ncbi:HNH endonuclease signature motif containing protein [Aliivibrio fischeri]|uniref:HNH endonuclease signature motif containing protein n=1 Tax=Aliivibrio fischeri TaxID=668 RepID=UPI000AF7C78D|nr:HNH endonuclease signature motif containing protein [Aliivibrio fischeri]
MSLDIPKPTKFIQAGYKPVEGGFDKKEEKKQETSKERAARHTQERREELTYTKNDELRWARNRERVLAERKKIKVPSFNLTNTLNNPELDGVKTVNIDPVSMGVETVIDLINNGKKFIANPSLGGVAAMAVTAIPGKYADRFIGKYKGKDIELTDVSINTINYKKRERESYIKLRKEFNSSIRNNFLKDLSKNDDVIKQLKSHGVKDGDIAKLADGKLPRGYQVHHKIPIDDGGTNSADNLVLIRNSPEHSVFTTYQRQQTSNLSRGTSVNIEWPSPNGNVYPKK